MQDLQGAPVTRTKEKDMKISIVSGYIFLFGFAFFISLLSVYCLRGQDWAWWRNPFNDDFMTGPDVQPWYQHDGALVSLLSWNLVYSISSPSGCNDTGYHSIWVIVTGCWDGCSVGVRNRVEWFPQGAGLRRDSGGLDAAGMFSPLSTHCTGFSCTDLTGGYDVAYYFTISQMLLAFQFTPSTSDSAG